MTPPRAARYPGLDGLRALAVAAVVLFHLGRLPGGNLGVDTFFVLSGWLITTRLLEASERAGDRRVDLRAYWAARARRLLPASLVLVATVSVVWTTSHIAVRSLPHDVAWALVAASNWGTITGGGDYWARFGEPSPLAHFWSLAVEEQFYLVWPVLLYVVVRRVAGHRDAVVGALSLGLAGVSVAFMVATFDPARPTATYMHSVARAHSLLIGVAAAALTVAPGRRASVARVARRAAPVAAAFVGAVVLCSSERSTWLFSWGFPTYALATAVIVVAVALGRGGSWLDAPAARWVGDRSYGIYLWHWPVILYLRGDRAPFGGLPLDALRIATAVGLAAASYRWLEVPVRTRRLAVRWQPALAVGAVAACAALALVRTVPTTEPVTFSSVPLPAPAHVGVQAPISHVRDASDAATSGSGAVAAAVEEPTAPTPDLAVSTLPAGPVRTLVVGDSTAVRLSEAVLPYAEAHPDEIAAGSAAFGGCGLTAADDGRLHSFTTAAGTQDLVDLSKCTTQWREVVGRVGSEGIDVVLVAIGPWDGVDIHLPDGTTVSVLDPAGKRLVASAYRTFVRDVEGAGARVVWVRPPDVHLAWTGVTSPLDDGRRWRVLRTVVDRLPVERIDLPAWLRDNGLDGPAGRPDGVHLDPAVNARFVADLVVPTLTGQPQPVTQVQVASRAAGPP